MESSSSSSDSNNGKKDASKRAGAMETLVLLARGFGLVFRSSPFLTPMIMLIGLLLSAEPVASLWIMKLIIDRLTGMTFSGGFAWANLLLRSVELITIGGLLAVQFSLWVASRGFRSVEDYLSNKAQLNFELYIQTRLMKKCSELDLAFFEDPKNLDHLQKAMRGSSMSAWNLIWMLFNILRTSLTLVSYLVLLFALSWIAPIVVLITTAPQMLASARSARKRWHIHSEELSDTRLRYYLTWLMIDKDCNKELKLFNLTDHIIQRYRDFAKKFYNAELAETKRNAKTNFFLGALSNIGTIGLWIYILVKAVFHLISTGDAVLFMGAAESSRHTFLNLFNSGGRLVEQVLFLSDLFEMLDKKPESVEGSLKGLGGPGSPRWGRIKAPESLQHGIEFKDVCFSYPGSARPALDHVSFYLPVGQSTAIVGKNGAGKTTIIKLLVRLYDPTSGDILIDGRNIKEYEINSLRKMFSVVFQDYVRYYLTLRENIGFGDIDRLHDSAQIEWAAKQSGADMIAEKLPAKYETYLARQYGLIGEELSGGEWQKVALARGFMRESAVIILDEPTSNLDAFAEMEVYSLFEELTAGKASIIISHRFSTVKVAKNILVLDNGKLMESGTHQELMEKGGLYKQMYSVQAERYK